MPASRSSAARKAAANSNNSANSQRCRYPNKVCMNQRARKSNGALHRFCEFHRAKANQHQKRWQQRRLNAKRFYDDILVDENGVAPTTPKRNENGKTTRASLSAMLPQTQGAALSIACKKPKLEIKRELAGSVSPSTPGEVFDDVDWLDLSALLAVPSKPDPASAPIAVNDVFSTEDLLPVTWVALPEPTPLYPISSSAPMLPPANTGTVLPGMPPMVWML